MDQGLENPFLPLFHSIESLNFTVETGIASGMSLYIEIMTNYPAVVTLREAILGDVALSDWILERIKWIVNQDFDKRYENPYDNALATYLYILNEDTTDEIFAEAWGLVKDVQKLHWPRWLNGYC